MGRSYGGFGFFALVFIHEVRVQSELREVFWSCAGEFEAPDLGTELCVGFFGQVDRPKVLDSAGRVCDSEFFCAVPGGLGNLLPSFSGEL